jgi:two-component system chemotaxis response regulator CheB
MIIIAPGNSNMIIEQDKRKFKQVSFCDKKYPDYNNPSINALMHSVAKIYGKRAIGVILTGMGKDGVNGLKEIKEKGGYTIAQSKESCVIYGMPKAAMDQHAVVQSMDVKEIGGFLVNCL